MPRLRIVYLGIIVFGVSCLGVRGVAVSQTAQKVLVLPYNIYSDAELAFLKKGIEGMLVTRLNSAEHLQAIKLEKPVEDKTPVEEFPDRKSALAAAKILATDYVIWGSVTALGQKVSTDAEFLSVATGKVLIQSHDIGEDKGDVLLHVDRFAERVKEYQLKKNFSEKSSVKRPAIPQTTSSPAPQDAKNVVTPLKTGQALLPAPWSSPAMPFQILGLAVADVNQDGKTEYVLIDEHSVYIYQRIDGQWHKADQLDDKNNYRYYAVDIADCNQNRVPEIFITCVSPFNNHLTSFVLEWRENAYRKIATEVNWFFRVIGKDLKHALLLGQKPGVFDPVFGPGIHELTWEKGAYVSRKQLTGPPKASIIYGFNYGHVLSSTTRQYVSIFSNGYLSVLNEKGESVWTSSSRYGGHPAYIKYPSPDEPEESNHFYLEQRIHLEDFDQDGLCEILVPVNQLNVGLRLERYRNYKSGYIECLSYNGVGFDSKWRTESASGYVADFACTLLDGRAEKALVYAVVNQKGFFEETFASVIVIRDLP